MSCWESWNHPGTPQLVAAFFNPAGPFEGDLLHTIPGNDSEWITLEDLFAVSMLDVRVLPHGVRRLLRDQKLRDEIHSYLKIPTNVDIWRGTKYLGSDGPARKLWLLLQQHSGDGIGHVTAGKLLCRKRPHLIPIVDSVVEQILAVPSGAYWSAFGTYLRGAQRRVLLQHLRPIAVKRSVPILGVLDVSLWMWGSQSAAAKRTRDRYGLPTEGWCALPGMGTS